MLNIMKKITTALILAFMIVFTVAIQLNNVYAAAGDVAQIGSDSYSTLALAVDAVGDGGTITLLDNISLTGSTVKVVTKSFTLNLNGKNIVSEDRVFDIQKGTVTLTGQGKIQRTLDSSYTSSTIKVSASSGNAGVIVGQGVTVDSTVDYAISLFGKNDNLKTLEVNGTVSTEESACTGKNAISAISGIGSAGYGNTDITINNGAVVSSKNGAGIYHPEFGTLTINGGIIIGGASGIEAKAGNIIINGGSINTTGTAAQHTFSNGLSTSGYAVALVDNVDYSPTKDSSVLINGGAFTGEITKLVDSATPNKSSSIAIVGGYYTIDPSSYVSEGYRAEQGTWPGNYPYAVNKVPAEVNKVETVSAAVTDSTGTVDAASPVSASLTDSVISLNGKIDASSKSVTIMYTATDGTTGTKNVYDASSKKFVKPDDFTVGNTTYTVNIDGLSLLPSDAASVAAKPTVENPSLPAESTQEETNAAVAVNNAIKNYSSASSTVGLASAASDKIGTTTQNGNSVAGIESSDQGGVITASSQKTIDALTNLTVENDQKVVMVAQPYLDIQVTGVDLESSELTGMTLTIEPKYNIVAVIVDKTTTVNGSTTINSWNSAVVASGQSINITTPVMISIPLPSTIKIADENNFYVKHVHTNADGTTNTYYYKAKITHDTINNQSVRIATFTTTNGFSTFTFLSNTWNTTINFKDVVTTGYTLSDVDSAFPVVSQSGYTFEGWKISDGTTTYADSTSSLTYDLLKDMNGKAVTATAVYTKITYDLSVNDISFDAITYGDAQPAAKPITITSIGNADATIASVTVDNKNFVIAGSGTTVTAGKTLTTWTIQPAKGLAAGTYKGTITITYDNGATSTSTVTFTVNKASETNASSSNTNTTKTSSVNTGATSGIMEWGIAFILAVMIAAYAWLSLKHQIIE